MTVTNASTPLSFTQGIPLSIHKAPLSIEDKQKFILECSDNRTPKTPTEISAIVVAYHEEDDLLELIDSLEQQKQSWTEIILVDNGLHTSIAEALRNRNILYIKATQNLGCCGGRNLGASMATGNVLLFLDADGKIDSCLLENVQRAMQGDVKATRGRVTPKNQDLLKYLAPPDHYDLGDTPFPHQTNTEGISAWDATLFKLAGGFEEALYGYEGPVLNYRMHELFGVPASSFIYSPYLNLRHDYSVDATHLEKKLRSRMIQKNFIDNRYPLLQNFLLEYKREMPAPSAAQNLKKAKTDSRKIRKKIKKENTEDMASLATYRPNASGAPVFSVIIPCYNLGKFLLPCLASIRSQTLNPIEIIVVDDASTDQYTKNILDTLDPSTTLIRIQENKGVSHARNVGIAAAKAPLILCLDADDTISETYLEKAFNVFAISDEIGLVSTWVKMHGERNTIWKPKDRPKLSDSLISSPIPTATCFKKSVWEATGAGFDTSLRGYEDWDFWLSVLEKGYVARVIPSINYYYYTRPDSKVKTSNKNAYELTKKIVENHASTYCEHLADTVAQQKAKNIQLKHKLAKMKKRGKLDKLLLLAGLKRTKLAS